MATGLDVLLDATPGPAQPTGLDVLLAPTAPPVRPMARPDPTGSFGNNFLSGMGQFVSNTGLGAKQLWNDSAAALEDAVPSSVRDLVNALGGSAKPAQAQGRADIAEHRSLDAPLNATAGGFAGNMAGAMLSAPLAPVLGGGVAGAALTGGALGATQPALSWGERGTNTALSAALGGGTQAVLGGAARAISPQVRPEVQSLLDAGITPTPGQIAGGGFKRAEEAMTSVPVLGDAIKGAQGRGIEQLNATAWNRALSPIGDALPKSVTSGRAAAEYAQTALGDAYNKLLPKLTTQMDPQFAQDVGNLSHMVASGNLPATEVNQFSNILQTKVLDKFMGQNAVTGETLKNIESDLGQLAGGYLRDPSADKKQLGGAISELQDNLRSLVQRSNPQYADELKAINTGYANFKRAQAASGGIGADAGTFTPAQLAAAVRKLDPSKDKAAYARGDALMQDLSDPAKSVLAPKLPDSGTAYRGMLGAMTAAGGAAATGHPVVAGGTALAALLGPALYSSPTQKALAAVLTKRPGWAAPTADELRYLAPLLSAGAAALPNSAK